MPGYRRWLGSLRAGRGAPARQAKGCQSGGRRAAAGPRCAATSAATARASSRSAAPSSSAARADGRAGGALADCLRAAQRRPLRAEAPGGLLSVQQAPPHEETALCHTSSRHANSGATHATQRRLCSTRSSRPRLIGLCRVCHRHAAQRGSCRARRRGRGALEALPVLRQRAQRVHRAAALRAPAARRRLLVSAFTVPCA